MRSAPDAQQLDLRRVAVDDDAPLDVGRRARHVGQPRRRQPAVHDSASAMRQPRAHQQRADHFLQRSAVRAEHIVRQHRCGSRRPRVERGRQLGRRPCRAPTGAARSGPAPRESSFRSAVARHASGCRPAASAPRRATRCGRRSSARAARAACRPRARAAAPPRSAPPSASSRAAGPGTSSTPLSPCSIHSPGAVPLAIGNHESRRAAPSPAAG